METKTIEGLVIRTIHFNESSEIVHLLTSYGVISVMCKGARKYKSHKLAFCIPLTRVKAIISDSKIPSLVDYTIIDSFDYVKEDLKSNLWFGYLLEIINKLPDNIYYKNIYNLLIKALELARVNKAMHLVLVVQTKLLKVFGVEPEFKKCVVCGNPETKFFSISSGGFLCMNHKTKDSEEINKYLELKRVYYFDLYNDDFSKLNDIDFVELFRTITSYYQYHIEINLHSLSSLII